MSDMRKSPVMAVQGGFLVVRPDPAVFDDLVEVRPVLFVVGFVAHDAGTGAGTDAGSSTTAGSVWTERNHRPIPGSGTYARRARDCCHTPFNMCRTTTLFTQWYQPPLLPRGYLSSVATNHCTLFPDHCTFQNLKQVPRILFVWRHESGTPTLPVHASQREQTDIHRLFVADMKEVLAVSLCHLVPVSNHDRFMSPSQPNRAGLFRSDRQKHAVLAIRVGGL